MPTLPQLRNEGPWWNAETMSPTMQTLAERLRAFYGVGPLNIGAKGDESPGHMRGAHRSRAWIKNSQYCTDRSYTVSETPGNRSGGNDNWLAGMDITVPAAQLIPMCQRLDVAVRSGQLEKITEWYGNDDGDSRVDGYNNIRNAVASSDLSHLWHLHLTFDRGRAGEDHSDLYAVLTGTGAAPTRYRGDQMNFIVDETKTVYGVSSDHTRVWAFTDVNLLARCLDMNGNPTPTRVFQNEITSGMYGRYEGIYWQSGKPRGPESVEVVLDDAALAEIAAAAEKGAEAGSPSEAELVAAAEKGANLAEDS